MNSIWRWRTSTTHAPRRRAHRPTGSANASTRLCSMRSCCIPQKGVSFNRRAADRSRCVDLRIQRGAATPGALVLRQNPDAHLPRCDADGKGEDDRGLTTSDTKTRSLKTRHTPSDRVPANTEYYRRAPPRRATSMAVLLPISANGSCSSQSTSPVRSPDALGS